MTNYEEQFHTLNQNYQRLTAASGETGKDFLTMHAAALKDGAISHKAKELMCLCVAISIRCEGCILDHLHHAINAGATREEIVETINTAILMSGGPAYVYGGKAVEVMDEILGNTANDN